MQNFCLLNPNAYTFLKVLLSLDRKHHNTDFYVLLGCHLEIHSSGWGRVEGWGEKAYNCNLITIKK